MHNLVLNNINEDKYIKTDINQEKASTTKYSNSVSKTDGDAHKNNNNEKSGDKKDKKSKDKKNKKCIIF